MDPAYTVRRAERGDLPRLVQLVLALQDHLEASNPGLWRMAPSGRSRLRAQLATRIDAPQTCALAAEHAEVGVVGAAFGRVTTNTHYLPSKAGTIDQLYVDPSHRRAGVGTALVLELCAFFAQAGADALTLRYAVGNQEATAFWTHVGFQPLILTVGAPRHVVVAQTDPARGAPP